jgi:hypothetical protein
MNKFYDSLLFGLNPLQPKLLATVYFSSSSKAFLKSIF